MIKVQHVLPAVACLLALQGCQPDNAVTPPSISPTRTVASAFDPVIMTALQSYNLSPADLASDENTVTTIPGSSGHVTQKSITIDGERIAYFETSGKGPGILLIHGNSQSSNSFTRQLQSPLGRIFHMISIDLPGHGLSAKSPNPSFAYQLPGYANLLGKVAKVLNMEGAVMVGWSLGGNIVLEAADQLSRAPGLMLVGAPPVSNPLDPQVFLPSPTVGLLSQPDLTEEQIQSIVPTFFKPGAQNIPDVFAQDIRVQDPLARLNLGVMIATGNFKDEMVVVRQLSVPLALVDGEHEQLTNVPFLQTLDIPTSWHNRVWLVPNAGHMAQWENPGYFNVLLAAFVIESNARQNRSN